MQIHNHHYKKGYIMFEALLAVVVFAMIVLSIIPMLSFLLRRAQRSNYEARASILLQEGMESTYNVFMSNWDAFPLDGVYHPAKSSSGKWLLGSGPQNNLETVFTRSIKIQRACRDSSGKLIDTTFGNCSGARDADSRIVNTKVSWMESGEEKKIEAEMLLVNLEAN